jgi:DNA polymerase (family X)
MSKGLRIPISEAIEQCKIITDLICSIEYEVCGSIRRKCIDCGDGDIVFWKKDRALITEIMNKALEQNIISKMSTMLCGLINNVIMPNGFKIDFWFAEEDGWFHKVQFYTGSHDYNEELIKLVKQSGKLLNRMGFFGEFGKRIIVNSEEELFAAYGIEYVTPENRSLIYE